MALINKQITGGSPALWTKFQECLLHPWGPDGQMTKMLRVYRPRRFQITWFGVNRLCGCWVPASTIFQEPLSQPWACPLCPHGQMAMTLHIYMLKRFQRTWFGVNRPSVCWVPVSRRFQKPLVEIPGAFIAPMGMPIWPQWANDHDIAHLEAETIPTNLIWSESAEWLLSYGPDKQTDRYHSIVPLFFFWNSGTKSGIFKLIS